MSAGYIVGSGSGWLLKFKQARPVLVLASDAAAALRYYLKSRGYQYVPLVESVSSWGTVHVIERPLDLDGDPGGNYPTPVWEVFTEVDVESSWRAKVQSRVLISDRNAVLACEVAAQVLGAAAVVVGVQLREDVVELCVDPTAVTSVAGTLLGVGSP